MTDKNAKARPFLRVAFDDPELTRLSQDPFDLLMATIDDLWDEPVESEPAPHLAAKPVTSEDPLFLQSDSDNEGGAGAVGPQPSKAPDDIGALFEVDDDDENGQLSNVTYEQLREDALSGGKVAADGLSNEGNEGGNEGPSTAKSRLNMKDDDGDKVTTKRTIPKLDEALLLSERGIPALIKDAKRWRPKGKGHEVCCFDQSFQVHLFGSSITQTSDLNRLIRMYQYWAHQMYPRHTFNDTIERVEKLTHSRRMHVWFYVSCRSAFVDLTTPGIQVALSVWHDEARGISRHQAPPDESIDIDGINSDEEGNGGASGSRQTSEPPTRPPSSASDRTPGPDDDPDMDGAPGEKSTGMQGAVDGFDFEVEMWDDTPFTDAPTTDPTNPTINPPKPLTKPPTQSFGQHEDQDMWDLVDELQAQAKSSKNTIPLNKPPAPADDDDWDDMYA